MPLEGVLRPPKDGLKTPRDWDQWLRRLNEQIKYDGERAVIDALTTIATRTGTDFDSMLQMLTDAGKAEDQRFLPQVSAGNVLSLQDINPLTASSDAVTATISVAPHTLQYGFGIVSYNGGTITGLVPASTYYVYSSDPEYQGGDVTYLATGNRQTVTADNGRYYLGSIVTAISATTAAITAATSANPIEFTTGTSHGWTSGDSVVLTALPGDFGTNLNLNTYVITVTAVDKFTIAVDGSLYAAYTTGGLASRVSQDLSGGAGGGGGWIDNNYYYSP